MSKGERKARNGNRKVEMASRMRAVQEDVEARQAGPDKLKWTVHDLIDLRAKTDNQRAALEAYCNGDHVGLFGSAGVGKTMLACYMASSSLVREEVGKIIIVRSAVEQRDQGFVPGDQEEKDSKFEEPYDLAFAKLFDHPMTYEWMKKRGLIEFRTTGNLRGLTFEDAVVIGDEIQNLNFQEMDTFITRLGQDSRLILCGDSVQCDLKGYETKGMPVLEEIAGELPNFTVVRFTMHDCQRHGLVRAWLRAVEGWYTRRAESRALQSPPTLVVDNS